MILLVDVGNTRVKWAAMRDGRLSEVRHAAHADLSVESLVEEWSQGAPGRIWVSSVHNARFNDALAGAVGEILSVPLRFLEVPARGAGVTVAYEEPARLGVDRFAAMVGARRHTERPCVVVDCGTAVTVDVVDELGVHRGGLILPGPSLMRRSLVTGTAGVLETGDCSEALLFARDTGTAIAAGSMRTVAAAIDRISDEMAEDLSGTVERFLTGGEAPAVIPLLKADYAHRPALVLEGLGAMAESAVAVDH